MQLPLIIQGGMGAGVSGWRLARAVSETGNLGVVAGTALATIFARKMEEGDEGGHLRRAMGSFPCKEMAARLINRFFHAGGKKPDAPFQNHAMPGQRYSRDLAEITVAAAFAEIFLAKENHSGSVGLNLLEKIQFPTLPTLFGAMLAGVDYILMGAGIPRAIPGVLDRLANGEAVEINLDVAGALPDEKFTSSFDPVAFFDGPPPPLERPKFLGIVSSAALATTLARKASGRVDGFVIEGPEAGGHNAPPRGQPLLSPEGEPVYGPRDVPEIDKIKALGLPFWLAGTYGRPGKLGEALALGAAGIQAGTAFAFCEESCVCPEIKQDVIRLSRAGLAKTFTDPLASPTGFPLKVVQIQGSLSDQSVFLSREKRCDLGYLRHAYRQADGKIGYRCPAEPEEDFIRKGGDVNQTAGRKCVCNGLLSTIGIGQVLPSGKKEPSLVTAGSDVSMVADFLSAGSDTYTAGDVVEKLMNGSNGLSPGDSMPRPAGK